MGQGVPSHDWKPLYSIKPSNACWCSADHTNFAFFLVNAVSSLAKCANLGTHCL